MEEKPAKKIILILYLLPTFPRNIVLLEEKKKD
jgi:hypothetical protein